MQIYTLNKKQNTMKNKIEMVNLMLINAQINNDVYLVTFLRNKLADLVSMYKKETVK